MGGINQSFFTDEQNLADLVTHMPEEDRRLFNAYGHNRIEAVFVDRKFIVYRPTGLTPQGSHKPPEVLSTVTVKDFTADARGGCSVTLSEDQHHQELRIGYVPRRLFNFPIFISVPSRMMLRWDARQISADKVWRSLSFALLVKTKNKSDFYSKNNVYAETPKKFRDLYPGVDGQFRF